MKSRLSLSLILFLVLAHPLMAELKLPAIISNNMVLQQQSKVPLWGWADPGKTIKIKASWQMQELSVVASEEGAWMLEVQTPKAGGPYTILLSGKNSIELTDVLIGEVWLCSGQSNMEMPLKGWDNQPVSGSEEAIAQAANPNIRLFTVERKISFEALDDCSGEWHLCHPESVADFSAVGYFFGLELYNELKVPIGLINSTWGGTPAEAWTSKPFIEKIPYFHTNGSSFDVEVFREKIKTNYEKRAEAWLEGLGFSQGETAPEWALPDFNDQAWMEVSVPSNWSNTVIGQYDGIVEFRKEFKVGKRWTQNEVLLELGPIDEMDHTYINGIHVGSFTSPYGWATPRIYNIPPGVLKQGKNIIAIQVANTSGVGGINGDSKKIVIRQPKRKFGKISLWGQWKARKGQSFSTVPAIPYCDNCSEPQLPTALYNGMIAPIIPFGIKGAIWYQGESNRYDGKLYGDIFPNMISNWRTDWGQGAFPFYFVQIAPYTYRDDFNTGLLREAQFSTMDMPNAGMVVTMDVGSLQTIHPPDKKTVGVRLAAWALNRDYNKDVACSGPLYKSYRIEGSKIRIEFDYVGDGLKTDGTELKHFMIAGRDRKFVPAVAKIEDKTVVVSSSEIKDPVAVRFGWDHTDMTNLFNLDGLPAGPFRTDKWK